MSIVELIAFTHHDTKPKLDIDISNVALLINWDRSGCQLSLAWQKKSAY